MSVARSIWWRAAAVATVLAAALWAPSGFCTTEGTRSEVGQSRRPPAVNVMHPVFAPLDSAGQPVVLSGRPVSSSRTCGACHDADAINLHNDHWQENLHVECTACHLAGGRFPEDRTAYEPDGKLRRTAVRISGPQDEHCASCHGIVHAGREPLQIPADFGSHRPAGRTDALTLGTGEILSGQDLSASFLNLRDKDRRNYPWDVHARRLVGCVDCHYAANNPFKADVKRVRPGFLKDDPRRIEISDYLRRPDHRLVAADCRACHDPLAVHDFLPYKSRHLAALDCRACHVPELFGPAARMVDSTVVTSLGAPVLLLRGYEPRPGESLNTTYAAGYVPLLRAEGTSPGPQKLAPFNAVERFAWREGTGGRAVPWEIVQQAYLENGEYAAHILAAFDADVDRKISADELRLDTALKVTAVRARLIALGAADPQLASAVTFHPIRHGVLAGKQVMRNCNSCHAREGRLAAGLDLASYAPDGLHPQRRIESDAPRGLHIFGHARRGWMDVAGFAFFLAAVFGVAVHGGIRFATRKARSATHADGERVYLYSVYERVWHWLMAASVLALAISGLHVHYTGGWGLMTLPQAVKVHNIFALVLTVNGFLSLFYHVTTAAIRQFHPGRDRIVGRVLEQVRFYTSGIFLGRPHPVPKTAERKLNPLQQITYLALLNVLFPLQLITGILIWGASRWPELADRVHGLTLVVPLHNLTAWSFLAFLVVHVYLTTTGHTVLSNVVAMVDGYDFVGHGQHVEKGGVRA